MGRKSLQQFAVLGLYTETPLHCGAESSVGFVDLPIQRERHTEFPLIPGSTLKGVLRDEVIPDEESRQAIVDKYFGPGDATTPGSVAFGDSMVVAFPVRSTGASFHWVSCAFVLERLFRLLGTEKLTASIPRGSALAGIGDRRLLVEEIALTVSRDEVLFSSNGPLTQLLTLLPPDDLGFSYTRSVFLNRFLVLNDEDFAEIVKTATEVVTRIKLNERGTTASLDDGDRGNMFVEELIPRDTLFVAPLRGDAAFLSDCKLPPILRLGGDETVGRGLTHVTCVQSLGGSQR